MTLRAQDTSVEIQKAALVHTLKNEIYSRAQHFQSCHSLKTTALLPPNPSRNAWCSGGQSTAPDTHGRTVKLNIIKLGGYYIYYY